MARLARIETLVGMPLAEVNEVALRRFVDGRVRDDQDLDFKCQLSGPAVPDSASGAARPVPYR